MVMVAKITLKKLKIYKWYKTTFLINLKNEEMVDDMA